LLGEESRIVVILWKKKKLFFEIANAINLSITANKHDTKTDSKD